MFDPSGAYLAPPKPCEEHKHVGMEKAVDLLLKNYGGCWQTLLERLHKQGFQLMEVK